MRTRRFIKEPFLVNWENIERNFTELIKRKIENVEALEALIYDRSEFESLILDDYAWRYIHMTCHTENEKYAEDFEYFTVEIKPRMATLENELDLKIFNCPFFNSLPPDNFKIFSRRLRNSISLFKEENIPLQTELQLLEQKYQNLTGNLTVEWEGQQLTLSQAALFLEKKDRNVRHSVWQKIAGKRAEISEQLDSMLSKMIPIRHQIAVNAGFENYRDYMFQELGRFDYSPQDCLDFHQSIEKHIVPLLKSFQKDRREKLGVSTVKPWDTEVDLLGDAPLKPFTDSNELLDKTIECFNQLDPYFGQCLAEMKKLQLFDLESRIGKAPGGYNYPFYDSSFPFIFMNAAGNLDDLTTLMHEGGHAVHTCISAHHLLIDDKNVPSEVAELASMSMELLSMKYWKIFFENPEDLKRAQIQQLQGVLKTLPWVATIDAFQHWIYTNPEHTTQERNAAWKEIFERFGAGFCDWSDEEQYLSKYWQKQLHIFEVPFYYIEYGIAQLAAIGIWKNSVENEALSLENYKKALSIGYTRTIPEIYKEAGVDFNFKEGYIKQLSEFIKLQLQMLN